MFGVPGLRFRDLGFRCLGLKGLGWVFVVMKYGRG